MREIIKALMRFKYQYIENSNRSKWQSKEVSDSFLEVENFFMKFKHITDYKDAIDNFLPDLDWAEEHFAERISGKPLNPPPSHTKWLKDTEEFFSKGEKKFSHSYPERFWPKSLMPRGIRFETADYNSLIDLLSKDVYTRQAYLPIFFNEDLSAALADERVPCTLGYYFYKDKCDRISCNYVIRSIDVVRHLHNDLFLTWLLLRNVCNKINQEIGNITLIAFNAHCFKNDLYTLNKRIDNGKD